MVRPNDKLISMNCFLFQLRWQIPEDSDHSGSSEPSTADPPENRRMLSGDLVGLTPWTVAVLEFANRGEWKIEWSIRPIVDQYAICEIWRGLWMRRRVSGEAPHWFRKKIIEVRGTSCAVCKAVTWVKQGVKPLILFKSGTIWNRENR